uniref:Uncharacterized protein n=1 Tax=Homo sapiens TaxID=9606 RepID=A0AAQ5BGN5_HUMAN
MGLGAALAGEKGTLWE